jgi:hypothetical protein
MNGLARIALSRCRLALGHADAAQRVAETLLARDGDGARSLDVMAVVWARRGESYVDRRTS